jgi:hypothetical protein
VEWIDGAGTAVDVDLGGTRIHSVGALAPAPRLRELSLAGLDLARVNELGFLVQLEEIDLSRARNVDLERLSGYRRLRAVTLDSSDVRTLEPLRHHPALVTVLLRGTPVRDLSPLYALPDLRIVQVSGGHDELARVAPGFPQPVFLLPGDMTSAADLFPGRMRTLAGRGVVLLPLLFLLLLIPVPARLRTGAVVRYRPVARYAVAGALVVLVLAAVASLRVPYLSAGMDRWARVSAVLLGGALAVMLAMRLSPRLASGRWAVDAWLFTGAAALHASIFGGFAVFIAIFLTLDPQTLRPGSWNALAVLMTGFAVLMGVVAVGVTAMIPIGLWERCRSRLRSALLGGEPSTVVVEVRLGFLDSPRRNTARRLFERIAGANGEPAKEVNAVGRMALDAAMLRACPVAQVARGRLRGVVVHASAAELERVHPREVEVLAEWLRDVYRHTWAPVWVVGDWVGRVESRSPALARSRRSLAPVGPLLSGFEYFSSLVHYSVLDQTPDTVLDALRHNQRMRVELLEEFGLPVLLSGACTPVAAAARAVFGAPELSERIRLLVEMLERAVAFFALALAAEATASGAAREHGKLRGALERNLARPTLADWISLLNAFRRHGATPLCAAVRAWLDAPYPAAKDVQRLRNALPSPPAGERAQGGTPVPRREVLDLARDARNHFSAHGSPADEAEVYKVILRVAIRLTASLPWDAAVFAAPAPGGGRIVFRGCLPGTAPAGEPLAEPVLVLEGDAPPVPARPFLDVDAARAVLMYAGGGRMLEAVSGSHLQAGAHG